jgi:hypothetical protein
VGHGDKLVLEEDGDGDDYGYEAEDAAQNERCCRCTEAYSTEVLTRMEFDQQRVVSWTTLSPAPYCC